MPKTKFNPKKPKWQCKKCHLPLNYIPPNNECFVCNGKFLKEFKEG